MGMWNVYFSMSYAARTGDLQEIQDSVTKYGLSYCKGSTPGYCLLREALKHEHIEIAEFLILNNCKVKRENPTTMKTPIYYAVKNNYTKFVELLLSKGASLDDALLDEMLNFLIAYRNPKMALIFFKYDADVSHYKNEDGYTLLHLAAERGNEDLLELLLKKDAHLNTRDKHGVNALYLALENRHFQVAKKLINYGICVNSASTLSGLAPIHLAAGKGNEDIVKLLLDNQANFEAKDNKGYTALHIAAREGNEESAKILLNNAADINANSIDKLTPLHVAVQNERPSFVKFLLEFKAEVNLVNVYSETPLYNAIQNGFKEIVNILLEGNADVHAKSKHGLTPLHVAVNRRFPDIVCLLLKHGADPNAICSKNMTPLHYAVKTRDTLIANILLENNASVNSVCVDGEMPLHLAVRHGCRDIVKKILEYNADVNSKFKDSMTALHIAANKSYVDIAKLLMEYNADVNAKCSKGMTPLHYAAATRSKTVSELLLKNNADINSLCNDGETALHAAVRNQNRKTVALLLEYNTDINILSKDGLTALAFAPLDDSQSLFYQYVSMDRSLNVIFSEHIIKRKVANLFVNEKNADCLRDYFTHQQTEQMKRKQNECENEITNMKKIIIIKGVASLFDVLTNNINRIARFVRNENTVKIMRCINYESEFPIYSKLLQAQLTMGVEREVLLKKFDLCADIFMLNGDCIDEIIKYISNQDLKTLILACNPL